MTMVNDLNAHLRMELGAHLRYNGHAEIIRFKGYPKLADIYKEESGEELGHADKIIHRIQQLEGMPDYQTVADIGPAIKQWDIGAIIGSDLEVEKQVLDSLAGIIEQAELENDWETSNVLRVLVSDTEHHITWLSTQVDQLAELGKQNYLQAMM